MVAVKCTACGRDNRATAAFCDGCGGRLARACSACGAEARADAQFCDSCGQRLEARANEVTQPPAHLVQKILRDRERIEGERRVVTVLFVDAKGFTPLSEGLDAEQVYELIQGCVQRMVASVHAHEGTVTQFTGDGIMAVFGAPIAREDSARRAVSAALEMQASLQDYANTSSIACEFRIGLNSGPVIVGSIGDDASMEYTAVGDTVNLASRMESMCAPGSVYLTEYTQSQVAEYFGLRDVGLLDVKGKAAKVHVYEVLGERGVRTRLDAAIARGLSPFTGRGRELEMLKGFWQDAEQGRGRIVLISGEPGIGKSRLLHEFREALPDDVIWREAHCITYGETIPYMPVVELVRNGFAINDADDEGSIVAKVDADIAGWTPEGQKTVPYLKFLLQVDPGDAAVEEMDPVERRAGILDALRALILERSRVAPRVVVVEDLHWADDQSEEAFRVCADAVAASAVLMILTFRPGYMHPSGDLPHAHRIVLSDLDPEARRDLARATLQASDLSPELAAAITTKAEGNPLFIEEVAKALAGGVANTSDVPNSLQDVILARIDRLAKEARDALQFASVIGREFTLRLLNRISDTGSDVETVLGELKALELIYQKAFFPELAYMFKHALTHDVAYSTLLVERRKALHRIVAVAIEDLYTERIAEHYETLAHHYERAESWDKALYYLKESATKAAAYATKDALRYYDRALAIAERTGDGAMVADLAHRRGMLNISIFAIADALEDFDRTLNASRAAGDEHLISRALAGRAVAQFFAHEFEPGLASADEALRSGDGRYPDTSFAGNVARAGINIVTGRLDEGIVAYDEACRYLDDAVEPLLVWLFGEFDVLLRNWRGDYAGAIAVFERWMPRLAEQGALATVPAAWAGAVALGGGGQYDRAIRTAEDAIAVCDRTEAFPDFRARTINTLGWIHGEVEDHERALEWNTQGLAVAREIPSADPEFENNALLNLGDNLAALGDLDQAEQRYREVENVVSNPRPADEWMLWRYSQHLFHSLGELALRRGDPEGAMSYAERCVERAAATNSLKNVVKGRRLRAETSIALGDLDRARLDLTEALVVARRIANPPQLWKTLAVTARVQPEDDQSDAKREAMSVVERIASQLGTDRARETLLSSPAVRALRA